MRLLKKPPSFVLGSKESSTYPTTGKAPVLADAGWVGENRYASGSFSPAALLDDLFEQPLHI
jgi:hypothetical protein